MRLSMNRYPLLCIGLLAATLAVADNVGYKTVAQALTAVKQMPGVSFSTVRGWTIVTDEAHLTVWSFSPTTDPSYPAVVRRMVISTGGGSKVTLDVLCEAKRAACDNLVREFKK
jgi:hypothetical protein